MQPFFLDAGAAYLGQYIAVLSLIIITVLETVILILLRFNPLLKCLLHALLVNLASLGAGYLLLKFTSLGDVETGEGWKVLILMFLVTVIIEAVLLALLNRGKPVRKILTATLAMNLISYLLLFFYIRR